MHLVVGFSCLEIYSLSFSANGSFCILVTCFDMITQSWANNGELLPLAGVGDGGIRQAQVQYYLQMDIQ